MCTFSQRIADSITVNDKPDQQSMSSEDLSEVLEEPVDGLQTKVRVFWKNGRRRRIFYDDDDDATVVTVDAPPAFGGSVPPVRVSDTSRMGSLEELSDPDDGYELPADAIRKIYMMAGPVAWKTLMFVNRRLADEGVVVLAQESRKYMLKTLGFEEGAIDFTERTSKMKREKTFKHINKPPEGGMKQKDVIKLKKFLIDIKKRQESRKYYLEEGAKEIEEIQERAMQKQGVSTVDQMKPTKKLTQKIAKRNAYMVRPYLYKFLIGTATQGKDSFEARHIYYLLVEKYLERSTKRFDWYGATDYGNLKETHGLSRDVESGRMSALNNEKLIERQAADLLGLWSEILVEFKLKGLVKIADRYYSSFSTTQGEPTGYSVVEFMLFTNPTAKPIDPKAPFRGSFRFRIQLVPHQTKTEDGMGWNVSTRQIRIYRSTKIPYENDVASIQLGKSEHGSFSVLRIPNTFAQERVIYTILEKLKEKPKSTLKKYAVKANKCFSCGVPMPEDQIKKGRHDRCATRHHLDW